MLAFQDTRTAICVLFGICMVAGCRHAAPDFGDLSDSKGDPRDKLAFTTRATVSEREDTYCLAVRIIQTVRTENRSGIDQLNIPELCLQKNDRSEQVVSLSANDPAPFREVLPFKKVPLEAGEPGLEVRFKVEGRERTNALAVYSILYRSGSGREHRWNGLDALPPKVSK